MAAGTYKTPGVYVEEIAKLPPSIAEVATAIPAFLGYTEKGATNKPTRITSILEYENLFGLAAPATCSVEVNETLDDKSQRTAMSATVGEPTPPSCLLHYSLKLFFDNGGGPCYIVSVGSYAAGDSPTTVHFTDGLASLEKVDEPTLIVLTDAVKLPEYGNVCQAALTQCKKLGDRFAIFDAVGGPDLSAFRTALGMENLNYGAAYYPDLKTTLNYRYQQDEDFDVTWQKNGLAESPSKKLNQLATTETAIYQQIKLALAAKRVTLPPSAAMAGVYARVDRDRGVWKAPANVSLNSVTAPTVKVTDNLQEDLNVDATSGKSINAIRSFTGKGTLIWGARTLAGNDNEWRYVNVRRLFIMIEESTRKATSFAVFEANDATTWLKVKGMIESFLYGLWERGALAGSKPESAYFVQVGLGTTMSPQDVLEGRMIVEIGIAAVRPAEFIVLRFSHKLQEA